MDNQMYPSAVSRVQHDPVSPTNIFEPPAFEQMIRLLAPFTVPVTDDQQGARSPRSKELEMKISSKFEELIVPQIMASFPRSTVENILSNRPQESGLQTGPACYSIAQLHILVHAAMNDLVGGSDAKVSFDMLYKYLRDPIKALIRDFSNRAVQIDTNNFWVWKDMARSMFISAMQSLDYEFVEFLLTTPQFGIDINSKFRVAHPRFNIVESLPLFWSIENRTQKMTELLVRLGAELNTQYRTALDRAVSNLEQHSDDCDYETVKFLWHQGAKFGETAPHDLIEPRHVELLKFLITTRKSAANRQKLLAQLPIAVAKLDQDDVLWFLDAACAKGLDLDGDYHAWRREQNLCYCELRRPCKEALTRLIDISAERGHIAVVQHFRNKNVEFTDDTMVAAMRSKNMELCTLLLQSGVPSTRFSPFFGITPLAEALRTSQTEIIRMLNPYGIDYDNITGPASCCITLKVVVSLANVDELARLLQSEMSENLEPSCYASALNVAVWNDCTPNAIMLLENDFSRKPNAAKSNHKRSSSNSDEGVCTCNYSCDLPNDVHGENSVLSGAIKNENYAIIEALLEHGIGFRDSDVLKDAVNLGDLRLIEELFVRGASFENSLARAISTERLDVMRLLLELGAGSCASYVCCDCGVDIMPYTVLQKAVSQGNPTLVRELLKEASDIRDPRAFVLASQQTADPGLLAILIETASRHQSLNVRPSLAFSFITPALTAAIETNKVSYVRDFLELGVSVLTCSDLYDDSNRFYREDDSPSKSWVDAIERDTGDFLRDGLFSPLAMAILKDRGQDLPMVKLVLEAGISHGMDIDNVIFLSISMFSSLENTSQSKYTALLLAILTRNIDLVRMVLRYGANPNAPASGGFKRSPLQKACEIGSLEIAQLLLRRGADVNAAPAMRGGGTALQLAVIGAHIGVVEFLLENGANILAPRAKVLGRTVLEGAAEHGRYTMVDFLVRHAPHPADEYESAIRFATANRHDAIAEMLRVRLSRQTHQARLLTSRDVPEEVFQSHGQAHGQPEAQIEVDLTHNPEPSDHPPHSCRDCNKTFTRSTTLKRHRAAAHPQAGPSLTYTCRFCDRDFARRDVLTRHEDTHTGAARVTCMNCGKTFSRSDSMGKHLAKCVREEE